MRIVTQYTAKLVRGHQVYCGLYGGNLRRECGRTHTVIGYFVSNPVIEDGPDHADTIAALYEGRDLPDVLKSLMNDLVECETLGGYFLMDDPTRLILIPKREVDRCWLLLVVCIMPDELPGIDDPGFFTWPGCASLFGIFMAMLGIAAGVYFAISQYTDGLLLVIICMLAGLLVVVATKAE